MVTIWIKAVPGGVVANRFGVLPEADQWDAVRKYMDFLERALKDPRIPFGTKVTLVVPEKADYDSEHVRLSRHRCSARDAAQGGAQ